MLTRKLLAMGVVAFGVLFAATQVSANPTGVPVAEPGPFSCGGSGSPTMPDFTITAIRGPNNEFPIVVACNPTGPNASRDCADYGYTITPTSNLNINHTTVAVSADQDLDGTSPTPPAAKISPPGAGDQTSGFLAKAFHEYTVRFNSLNKDRTAHIFIVGPSAARITTLLVGGTASTDESCLIAGPGVGVAPFKPITTEQTVTCAGGKCTCELTFDAANNITSVTSPDCPVIQTILTINNSPVTFIPNEGITIGNGTGTCFPGGICVC